MAEFRKAKKEDNLVSLEDLNEIVQKEEAQKENLHYAVLKFTHDEKHSVVKCFYWECELARAMNYAGIVHNRYVMKIMKPYRDHFDWAVGINCVVVGFAEKLPDDELISRINEHTIHMKVTGIWWLDGPEYEPVRG